MNRALVFRATPAAVAALDLEHVRETMRPLPFESVAGVPPFVAGLAVVRGAPTPVVDVRTLLGAARKANERASRWISVIAGARTVMLAVDGLIGVRELAEGATRETPLLDAAARGVVEVLSVLDGELVVVLRAARLIDEATWKVLEKTEVARDG